MRDVSKTAGFLADAVKGQDVLVNGGIGAGLGAATALVRRRKKTEAEKKKRGLLSDVSHGASDGAVLAGGATAINNHMKAAAWLGQLLRK